MPISECLLQAYQETHYHVFTEPQFFLQPSVYCAELAKLQDQLNVQSSAVITAWNPYSEQMPNDENLQNQNELRKAISSFGLQALPASGQHPSGDWPAEESFFIAGIGLSDASELGMRFGQNAIVYSTINAIPDIVILV